MIHFNRVKSYVIEIITKVKQVDCRYYVIRDVFGKINVYVEGSQMLEVIEEALIQRIGKHWMGKVGYINSGDFLYLDIQQVTKEIEPGISYGERPLTKKTWIMDQKEELGLGAKVSTFYSYKGGVGRTTTLVLTALQLVRQGKKVVVVDFDLEAPGVATLLIPEGEEYPEYGVIDFLIESVNENQEIDIDDYIYTISDKKLTGLMGGELFVMQATDTHIKNSESYFEKISRVDFGMPQYERSNNGVARLLTEVDERYQPDFILIDSRAGVHDIGGLTLTRYTDYAILVFYGNNQNMFGLNFVLPKLVEKDIPFYLVNSPMPISEEEGEEERKLFREHAFKILIDSGHYTEENMPDIEDESADHIPLDIRYTPEATMVNSISRVDTLLNNEGSSNVYFKLAEQLIDTEQIISYIGTQKLDRQIIIEAIKDIIPVEIAAAENEFKTKEDLRKRFYPLKEYKYIFDNNKFLVIGSKGSGKTALFSVLAHPEYAKELAKYVEAPMKDINKTEWVTGLGLGSDFPNKDNFNTIGVKDDVLFFRIYWQCLTIRVLKRYIIELIEDIPRQLQQLFECKYSEIKQIIEGHENIGEIISDILAQLDQTLGMADKIVTITYDALDFALDKKYRGKMIGALISFWFESMTRMNHIRAKIFLRDDIFKFEVKEGITDKVKLKNYTANLKWQYEYLLAMVWKRIVENNCQVAGLVKDILNQQGYSLPDMQGLLGYVPQPNIETNRILLREFIGEKMGKGNKAYTYNWISYRLSDTNEDIVPRSILKLFTISARNEFEQGKIGLESNSIIRPRTLENSLQEVSEDRLSDLAEEYPEYKNFLYGIKNYCSSFPVNEENFIQGLTKCKISKSKSKTVIDELKEIGILKEYQRKKNDPIRYHIPDIYLKGMGLSRKGYK